MPRCAPNCGALKQELILTPSIRLPAALLALTVLISAAGCSFSLPRVHKVTVQQGNLITQQMVDRLKPGMTRSQVSFVLGDPVMHNPFNADRWDYLYRVEVPDVYEEIKTLSLFFDGDLLLYFTGDYAPSSESEAAPAPLADSAGLTSGPGTGAPQD
jgi:outer membrane protein assembly factor BamE